MTVRVTPTAGGGQITWSVDGEVVMLGSSGWPYRAPFQQAMSQPILILPGHTTGFAHGVLAIAGGVAYGCPASVASAHVGNVVSTGVTFYGPGPRPPC